MSTELPYKALVAMIALPALPGSPLYAGSRSQIIEQALNDAAEYQKAGVDALLLENDFDVPYVKGPMHPEAFAVALEACKAVRSAFKGPIGIQILEAANEDALRIAHSAKLNFLRVEGYVYAHVGAAGIIEGCAGTLLRLRKELQCTHIKVFADLKKKHCAHALTADLDIVDELKQAELFLADGFVVTGKFTGEAPESADLKKVKSHTKLPVLIGSGMSADKIEAFLPLADGFIVGSTFRQGGQFLAPLEVSRLQAFMETFQSLRSCEKKR